MESNLYQLLLLQSRDSPQLASWLKKREYISPPIILKMNWLPCVAIQFWGTFWVTSHLLNSSLYHCRWSHRCSTQWASICVAVHWVDSSYDVHEAALGFIQLPIFSAIKYVVIRCSLYITNFIGQAYDGASNMSWMRNGVQDLKKKTVSVSTMSTALRIV